MTRARTSILDRWSRSYIEQMAVGPDGSPVPWCTYPLVDFIKDRIPPTAEAFEYGSGNSTIWWSERVLRIEACEHDSSWAQRISDELPDNASIHVYPAESDGYIHCAANTGRLFDILIIDGRRRVRCAKASVGSLRRTGIVIWDNTERSYYAPGWEALREAGLTGRIDFWGMGPIHTAVTCTSIFYRPADNFLGV